MLRLDWEVEQKAKELTMEVKLCECWSSDNIDQEENSIN